MTSDSTADLPLRQLTRLRAEMTASSTELVRRLFPGRAFLSVPFGIIARRSLPDWVRDDAIVRPADPTHAITVRQIAASLAWPPETVRRQVGELRERGAVTVSTSGVSLAATTESEPLVTRYLLGEHDNFVRLIEDLVPTCDLDLPIAPVATFGFSDIVMRSLDVLLSVIDTFRLPNAGKGNFLWGALAAIAVRGVTFDPVLARRYANDIPPDDLRIGISLRSLADAVEMPYATAWRHMRELHALGLVTRIGAEEWTILTCNLLKESALSLNAPPSLFLLRKVRELTLMGLDPARAGELYRTGRPPLARLGLPQNG